MPLSQIPAAVKSITDRSIVFKVMTLLREEVEARLSAIAQGGESLLRLSLAEPTEVTILGAAVTLTQSVHRVDTEGDAASDELDRLNGVAVGTFYLLRCENSARSIVLRDTGGGTGNIRTPYGKAITLSALSDWALLFASDATVSVIAFRTAAGDGGGAGALVGLLSALTTTEKGSVVGAINELVTALTTKVPTASVQQSSVAALVAGARSVANLNITASSVIVPIRDTEGGTPGALSIASVVPGNPGSFTIQSADGADTSLVRALVIG